MKIKHITKKNPLANSFAKPLSLDGEIEYRKLIAVEELLQFMRREGINRSELAERMGVGPSRITAMLSGDSNLTIDTLVRAGRAVGADLAQTFVPQGQKGHWVAVKEEKVGATECFTLQFNPVEKAPTPQLASKIIATHDAEDAA